MQTPSPNEGAKVFNPKFRRRRRHQGATWTPTNTSAEIGDGAWCKFHKQRHGYMTMDIAYEKRNGFWYILWSCKQTHQVLEEMRLGGTLPVSD